MIRAALCSVLACAEQSFSTSSSMSAHKFEALFFGPLQRRRLAFHQVHNSRSETGAFLLPLQAGAVDQFMARSRCTKDNAYLKGVMMATAPKGHRSPLLVWPRWSPGFVNPRARKRTCSGRCICTGFVTLRA